MSNESDKSESPERPAVSFSRLVRADLEGSPEDIARRLIGRKLPLSNNWGEGVVVGAWKLKGESVRLLLAWPNADNPDQLFNEDAGIYCPNAAGELPLARASKKGTE